MMPRERIVLEDYISQVQSGEDSREVAQELLDHILVEMGAVAPQEGDGAELPEETSG